ncbi:MAG TPA: DUF6456 domain-containing protein [Devosiaceae bacterium]|nr:DUF6456 domain-containing protein [Devosiaceae bacterium]
MPVASKRAIRFVRVLLAGGEARRGPDGLFRVAGERIATLAQDDVMALIQREVLTGNAESCRATPGAAKWLRRQLAECDPFAAQHRQEVRTAEGQVINLAESPLARLATPVGGEGEAFLAPHQVEAGERLRRLVERAQLRPRVTMSYDGLRSAGAKGGAAALELSDMAADARRMLADIARVLPRDCADVLLDVCGLEKGLQAIESERGWPRRSAKLVLRIGLDQLARHFGLDAAAIGRSAPSRAWREGDARPPMFPDG